MKSRSESHHEMGKTFEQTNEINEIQFLDFYAQISQINSLWPVSASAGRYWHTSWPLASLSWRSP
jgi:hypothetical protein